MKAIVGTFRQSETLLLEWNNKKGYGRIDVLDDKGSPVTWLGENCGSGSLSMPVNPSDIREALIQGWGGASLQIDEEQLRRVEKATTQELDEWKCHAKNPRS